MARFKYLQVVFPLGSSLALQQQEKHKKENFGKKHLPQIFISFLLNHVCGTDEWMVHWCCSHHLNTEIVGTTTEFCVSPFRQRDAARHNKMGRESREEKIR